MATATVLWMFDAELTNVILCEPADSDIARCGLVRPESLPSTQISQGGLLDTINVPLPLPPDDDDAAGMTAAVRAATLL